MTTMMLVAALALAATPALAQIEQPAGQAAMVQNPAAMLLARADEIGLTAEQVRQIEAIQARVEQENAPRLARLREASGRAEMRQMSAEQRAEMRERMQALQPLRQQVRETNRAAGVEIHALLTPEQQARAHALRRARAATAGQPAARGPGARHQGPAARGQRPGARHQGPAARGQRPGARQGPAAGRGAGQGVRGGGPMMAVQNPAAMLLRRSDHIGLTGDQVRQIEAIQARLEAHNAPRVAQLQSAMQAMRAASADQRTAMRERMDALRPVRQEIQEANRAAGEAIHALLTPEQQARVRTLRRAQEADLRPRGMDRRDGMGQQQRRGERGLRGQRGPRGGS